jgi:hypothetical protein
MPTSRFEQLTAPFQADPPGRISWGWGYAGLMMVVCVWWASVPGQTPVKTQTVPRVSATSSEAIPTAGNPTPAMAASLAPTALPTAVSASATQASPSGVNMPASAPATASPGLPTPVPTTAPVNGLQPAPVVVPVPLSRTVRKPLPARTRLRRALPRQRLASPPRRAAIRRKSIDYATRRRTR